MQSWSDRITNSDAWQKSQELKKILDSIDFEKYDVTIQENLERTALIIDLVIERLENTDARIININALTNLGSHLTSAVVNLNYWINGSGENYITSSVQSDLDGAIVQIATLAPGQDVPEARESITK
jgi:hypothetical protein